MNEYGVFLVFSMNDSECKIIGEKSLVVGQHRAEGPEYIRLQWIWESNAPNVPVYFKVLFRGGNIIASKTIWMGEHDRMKLGTAYMGTPNEIYVTGYGKIIELPENMFDK